MSTNRRFTKAAAILFVVAAGIARGQQATSTQPPMLDDSLEAAESDEQSARHFEKWNSFQGPYATVRFGGSAMYDVATYSQDDASKEQVGDLEAAGKWRDFRFVLSGTFPKVPWLTWKAGVMWDGPSQSWLVRGARFLTPPPRGLGAPFHRPHQRGLLHGKAHGGHLDRGPGAIAVSGRRDSDHG